MLGSGAEMLNSDFLATTFSPDGPRMSFPAFACQSIMLLAAAIAGRSSLGTEAACTAFTDPSAIAIIRQRLQALDIDLENHKQPFWVVASMRRALGDEKEEAVRGSLEIVRVERFVRR